ncbi:MAG: hypothetical protein Kow0077_13220 [Anaerolineae bacterium]
MSQMGDDAQQSVSWEDFGAEQERVRVLRQFISDVSHDLRTPLTIINSAAYMLQLKVEDAEQQQLVERIRAQVRRLDQIIDDMFTMTTLDLASPDETYRTVDLNELGQALYHEFSAVAQQKDLTLAFFPGSVQLLMADGTHLWRALSNLVINAINYTPPGGRIVLSTYVNQDGVVFEVTDTGIGIPAEDLPRIFDRFYRADKARQTSTGGSGLGLSIARRIVEYHNGRIEVESTPGKGSTFRVILPTLKHLIAAEQRRKQQEEG